MTRIIPGVAGYKYVDPGVMLEAGADGTRLHEIVEQFIHGEHDPDRVSLEDAARVALFAEWYEPRKRDLVCCEKRMTSLVHDFNGQPDLVMRDGIYDLKRRRTMPKRDCLQLAGYSLLVEEEYGIKTDNWYVLELTKDRKGVYRFRPVRVFHPQARALFLALLQYYRRGERLDQQVRRFLEGV